MSEGPALRMKCSVQLMLLACNHCARDVCSASIYQVASIRQLVRLQWDMAVRFSELPEDVGSSPA